MIVKKRLCLMFFSFLACILLTACGVKKTETPWLATSTLATDDVKLAVVWANVDGHVQNRVLTFDETKTLLNLINQIQNSAYTENTTLSGTTPEYGVEIIGDNMTLRFNQSISPNGAIELLYDDKSGDDDHGQWHVDSNELSDLLALLSGYKKSEQYASATDISSRGKSPLGQLLEDFTDGLQKNNRCGAKTPHLFCMEI